MVNLALLYVNGSGGAKDESRAWELLSRAAEAGAPDAQMQIGMDYKDGVHGRPKDPRLAEDWLRKAADQGNVPAEFQLAMFLFGSKPEEAYYLLGLVLPRVDKDSAGRIRSLRDVASAKLTNKQKAVEDERVRQELSKQAGPR